MKHFITVCLAAQLAYSSYIYGSGKMALGVLEFVDTDPEIQVEVMDVDSPGVLRTSDWAHDSATGVISAMVKMNTGVPAKKCLLKSPIYTVPTVTLVDCEHLPSDAIWLYDKNSGDILLTSYMSCLSVDLTTNDMWDYDCAGVDPSLFTQSFFIESAFEVEESVTLEFRNQPGMFITPVFEERLRYGAILSDDANHKFVFTRNSRVRYVNSSLCLSFDQITELVFFEECQNVVSQIFTPLFYLHDSEERVAIRAQSGSCIVMSETSNSITLGTCDTGALSESTKTSLLTSVSRLPNRIYQIGSTQNEQLMTYQPDGSFLQMSSNSTLLNSLFIVDTDESNGGTKLKPYLRNLDDIYISNGSLIMGREEEGSEFHLVPDLTSENAFSIMYRGSSLSSIQCATNVSVAQNWKFYDAPISFSDFTLVRIWSNDRCLFGLRPQWVDKPACTDTDSQFVLIFNHETGFYNIAKHRPGKLLFLNLTNFYSVLIVESSSRPGNGVGFSGFAILYDPSKGKSALLSVRMSGTTNLLQGLGPYNTTLLPISDAFNPFQLSFEPLFFTPTGV